MLTLLFQIALNTFRETLRQPIYFLVLMSALVLISIMPIFTMFVFREQVKLVVDSALAITMLFGWIAAALSASHTISREIRNGTALLVLSKPVNRPLFIGAKILGIQAALTIFCLLSSIATLVAVRVAKDQFEFDNKAMGMFLGALVLGCVVGGVSNYMRQSSFAMDAVLAMLVTVPLTMLGISFLPGDPDMGCSFQWPILPALVLVWFSVLAMGTLATALSTRLDLVPNLVVCGVVFVLGLVSDYMVGRHAAGNFAATVAYSLLPNWQLFWMADALAAQKTIPWRYVAWGGLYMLLFCIQFLLLAVAMFWRREIGKQDAIS